MLLEQTVIEGPYLRDLLQQPEALRRSLEGFEDSKAIRGLAQALAAGDYKRIVLTGMGSSLHALYPLHLTLTLRGLPSLVVETAELVHTLSGILDQGTLVVAVSQSGQSAEVVRLLTLSEGRAPVIGVTNNEGSELARRSTACVAMRAGAEASVSCKTYLASLLALEWLGAMLTGGDLTTTHGLLRAVVPHVEEYLSGWRGHVAELCGMLEGVRQVFVTGRGFSLATALTGGLILKESARFPAEGMSCAAFRHGPFETLAPHVLVVVLAGDSRARVLNRRLANDVDSAGGRSALIDTDARQAAFRIPELPDPTRPVVEMLPVQMISLALAARQGREAGRFELASKVTAIE